MVAVTVFPLLLVALFPLFGVLTKLRDEYKFHEKYKKLLPNMQLSDDLAKKQATPEELNKLRKCFVYFDKDGDGSFTLEELVTTMRELRLNPHEEEVAQLVKEADVDGDGEVTFEEFASVMIKQQNHQDSALESRYSFDVVLENIAVRKAKDRRNMVIDFILILSFLVLVSTSTTLFHYFKCHTFHEAEGGKQSYLYLDYSISCLSDRYKGFEVYAILMILVYPVGIPLLYYHILQTQKTILSDQELLEEEESLGYPNIGHLLFLSDAYKPEYYYFEVLECVRRLLLGSVVGIISADSASSAVMGILVSTFFLSLLFHIEPYRERNDNFMSHILAYSLTLLFLAALMLKVEISEENIKDEELFDVLLILVTLAAPTVITYQIVVYNGYGILNSIGIIPWIKRRCGFHEVEVSDKQGSEGDIELLKTPDIHTPSTSLQDLSLKQGLSSETGGVQKLDWSEEMSVPSCVMNHEEDDEDDALSCLALKQTTL